MTIRNLRRVVRCYVVEQSSAAGSAVLVHWYRCETCLRQTEIHLQRIHNRMLAFGGRSSVLVAQEAQRGTQLQNSRFELQQRLLSFGDVDEQNQFRKPIDCYSLSVIVSEGSLAKGTNEFAVSVRRGVIWVGGRFLGFVTRIRRNSCPALPIRNDACCGKIDSTALLNPS